MPAPTPTPIPTNTAGIRRPRPGAGTAGSQAPGAPPAPGQTSALGFGPAPTFTDQGQPPGQTSPYANIGAYDPNNPEQYWTDVATANQQGAINLGIGTDVNIQTPQIGQAPQIQAPDKIGYKPFEAPSYQAPQVGGVGRVQAASVGAAPQIQAAQVGPVRQMQAPQLSDYQQMGKAADIIASTWDAPTFDPPDLDNIPQDYSDNLYLPIETEINQRFEDENTALDAQMRQQGILPGSGAYNAAMADAKRRRETSLTTSRAQAQANAAQLYSSNYLQTHIANQQSQIQALSSNQQAIMDAAKANQQASLTTETANLQARMQADSLNLNALMAAEQLNTQLDYQANALNANLLQQSRSQNADMAFAAQQANAQFAQQAGIANQQADLQVAGMNANLMGQALQSNAQMAMETLRTNAQLGFASEQANAELGMRAQEFNANSWKDMAQFNAQLTLSTQQLRETARAQRAQAYLGYLGKSQDELNAMTDAERGQLDQAMDAFAELRDFVGATSGWGGSRQEQETEGTNTIGFGMGPG
jgi:hypothetical protein